MEPTMKPTMEPKIVYRPAVSHFVHQRACMGCHGPVLSFKNEESERDYQRFGLCQKCLDNVFGPELDEQGEQEV